MTVGSVFVKQRYSTAALVVPDSRGWPNRNRCRHADPFFCSLSQRNYEGGERSFSPAHASDLFLRVLVCRAVPAYALVLTRALRWLRAHVAARISASESAYLMKTRSFLYLREYICFYCAGVRMRRSSLLFPLPSKGSWRRCCQKSLLQMLQILRIIRTFFFLVELDLLSSTLR